MSLIQGTGGGLGGAGAPGGALGNFYSHLLDQSLRVAYGNNPYLTRTNTSAPTNNSKGTFSCWIKRGLLGSGTGNAQYIIHTGTGTSNDTHMDLKIGTDDEISIGAYSTTPFNGTAKFRDPSAWYHLVVAFDSTSATASDRQIKVYVNGEETDGTKGAIAQNDQFPWINQSQEINIFRHVSVNRPYDGYIAEINMIDGTALTAASFGETKNGIWIPKDTSGLTFGTNGFHLTFKDDVVSEGFNTVTYSGRGAVQSVSGLGFSPAMVWTKERDGTSYHEIHDVVRGANKQIFPNATDAEESTAKLTSFDGDGFSLAAHNSINESGKTYVGWAWDAGDNNTPTGHSSVTYTGTGATQNISGLGFSPDLVWIKVRNNTNNHRLFDTVRGAGKDLISNSTGSESTTTTRLQSFDSDGFTVGTNAEVNSNGHNIVAWAWDAGNGSPVSNTDGSITSTVKASQANGFSIVSYAGSLSATGTATVGHGLSSAPEMIIFKGRDTASNWWSYHTSLTNQNYLVKLNSTDAEADKSSNGSMSAPTSTVFDTNYTGGINTSDDNHIAYCFHSVTGYSSFGSYTGNGSSSGPTVTTGFRPGFILVKRTDSSGFSWVIWDGSRNPLGDFDDFLQPQSTAVEANNGTTKVTPSATGFQVTGTHTSVNASGGTYIYMAFKGSYSDYVSDVNTDGTINSRVRANTGKGFSITSFVGNATAGATVGHSLNSTPEMLILKNRDSSSEYWTVFHTDVGNTKSLFLNSTGAEDTSSAYWNNTSPTNSVFSLGNNPVNNGSGNDIICYSFHSVTGYSKISSYTGNGSSTGPSVTLGFRPAFLLIKSSTAATGWAIVDNTRSPTNPTTKTLFPDLSNVEYTSTSSSDHYVDLNSNGFQIKNTNSRFNANGETFIYMAFADTREAAFFKDVTTNGNHWTPVNLDYRDSVPDVPTNNFATLNALDNDSMTLSNGNLTGVSGANAHNGVGCTFGVTGGKWYWEVLSGGTGSNFFFGMGYSSFQFISQYTNDAYNLGDFWAVGTDGTKFGDSAADSAGELSYGSALSSGDILQLAFDLDNGKFYAGKNGTYFASGDPAAGSNPAFTTVPTDKQMQPFYGSSTSPVTHTFNFGQDSSFGGLVATENSNSDGNGHGSFAYAPPSGFLALCSQNLPDVAITDGTDNFNTVLYTGNAGTQAITGVGFSPDFIWNKQRNGTYSHYLFNSITGTGKFLKSDSTSAESTNVDTVTSFDTDGFTLGNAAGNNGSGNTMVSWNWLAGGAAPAQTYAVTVASDSGQNKYRFDGNTTFAPTLNLQEGGTYTFDQSDSSNSGHPLRFSTTSNGTHASGSEYTTGVTTTGTPGSAGAKTVITVAASAATLYYYCSSHSGMGGQVNTNATFGSTHLDGSILSTVSANTEAGFSIVSYTGTGSNATIAHGLNSAPEMLILKNRDSTSLSWPVYHAKNTSAPETDYLYLNQTQATVDQIKFWNDTAPTSTVFSIGNSSTPNSNGAAYIAYCFHSVEGYSKVGSYTGNGSSNGPFIYTGFRPAWILTKKSSATGNWILQDTVRDSFNPSEDRLYPNENDAEIDAIAWDSVSNGFKIRNTSSGLNTNGATIIYLAFAESPFKFANAR